MRPEVDCWLQTRAVPSQKWCRTDLTLKKFLAETKASIHNPFFFRLDLLWITGLSSRHQDVHCRKGRCFTSPLDFYLDSLSQEQRTVWTQPPLHSVCCNDWHTFAQSSRSVCQIQRDDSVAQKYEKRAFRTHVWLLTHTDCKFGRRIVYKSRL